MKFRTAIVTAGLCLAIGSVASAGLKTSEPVSIDVVNRQASGSLATARNSSDGRQAIGCSVFFDAVNRKNNVNCFATDAAGNSARCATQQAELIQIALAINGGSSILFVWSGSECTNIAVNNASWVAPAQP